MRSATLFPRITRAVVRTETALPEKRIACVPSINSLIEYGAYVAGKKVRAEGIEEAVQLVRAHNDSSPETSAYVWVGLYEPEAPEVEWLAETFGLHPLAVEDAIKAHQRPKVERYGDSLFVVLKTVAFVDPEAKSATSEIIATGEIMVFVGPDFVVTVRHGAHSPLADVREKLEDKPKLLNRGPTGVLHAIADYVVDKYLYVADQMQAELEDVEAAVFAEVSSRDINRIYQLKREMLELKRAVGPLLAPFNALPQRRIIPSEMREYFRDVGDHLSRVCEQVQSSNELSDSILQAALARTNALANEDMRKISSWVAILAVPTMIAGIYGMNFDHMPETHEVWGYPAVLGVMIVACTLLHRAFRRNGWL
ncbi:magnesium transporter CorA [Acrocarpospora phusangensis]|uniref:Magnesium transport protein CorA n=1 Tax=Acrocarpospora phusangensis TaxID=1070424 RepID=A0A919USB0_9ACTN|nr:magnesium transporter CorA [Acrocarpospora phusangensis]